MTLQDIKNSCTLHHTATTRGYMSRKLEYSAREYSGKFGRGFIVETPSRESTRYHKISYYIFK